MIRIQQATAVHLALCFRVQRRTVNRIHLLWDTAQAKASEANKKIELSAEYGTVRATGAVESVSNLQDFAEYFESVDGKKIDASYLVALEGDKIRKADRGDKILGVVSKTAGLVLGGGGVLLE